MQKGHDVDPREENPHTPYLPPPQKKNNNNNNNSDIMIMSIACSLSLPLHSLKVVDKPKPPKGMDRPKMEILSI